MMFFNYLLGIAPPIYIACIMCTVLSDCQTDSLISEEIKTSDNKVPVNTANVSPEEVCLFQTYLSEFHPYQYEYKQQSVFGSQFTVFLCTQLSLIIFTCRKNKCNNTVFIISKFHSGHRFFFRFICLSLLNSSPNCVFLITTDLNVCGCHPTSFPYLLSMFSTNISECSLCKWHVLTSLCTVLHTRSATQNNTTYRTK